MTDTLKADLVLEGGGVKGIALVGALSVLMDAGYEFPRVAGTSAGAIVGALLASGKGAPDLRAILEATDYRRFQDESWVDRLPAGKLVSLLLEDGIYEGAYLRTWLAELLGEVDTFADLALPPDPDSTLLPEQRYRLVVNVSDVSLGRLVRFPWDYQRVYGLEPGQQRVADAVRASMSIPFFFEPVRFRYQRTRDGQTRTVRSVLVDGGMLSNFPVDIFDRTDGRPPRWPTFGIKLSSKPGSLSETFPKDVEGLGRLAAAMVGTLTSFRDAMHVDDPAVQARTIFVDTKGVKSTDFDLSQTAQRQLFDAGVRAADKFLASWDFEAYKAAFRSGPPS